MKANKIMVLVVFCIILAANTMAAESLVWKTVDGKPTVTSFNALDSGSKLETEPSLVQPIVPVIMGENNIVFLVNSESHNANTKEVICKETCVIYTGFEKTEAFQDTMKYAIASIDEYSAGHLIINKLTNEKLEVSDESLLNEEIAYATTPNGCSVYNNAACFHYKINQDKLHTLRLTNAKIIFNDKGEVKLIQGMNRDKLETAWIDGLGIPLMVNDGVSFSQDVEGNIDYSKPRLIINPDVKDKEEWLKNLPDKLKKDGRSSMKLCGNQFTNYFSNSDFLIEKTDEGCLLKEYTLNTELFVEDDISSWKEFEYKCGELKFQAIGGKLKNIKCTSEESLLSSTEENSNEQMFRMKLDQYWLSINENSGFRSAEKRITDNSADYGTIFKVKELRVAHDIPGRGGYPRYKGDLIKSVGDQDTFISFIVPGDATYKRISNYLEPQIHVDSSKIDEITRKMRRVEYSYFFQEPLVGYILQLRNELNLGPIAAIFPSNYELDDREVTKIISYKGDDILTFGVSVLQGTELSASESFIYVLKYDPDYKKELVEAKNEGQKEKVSEEVTVGDYVSQKCYGKNYDQLTRSEEDSVDYVASQMIDENNLVPALKGGDYGQLLNMNLKDKDITFPSSETVYTNANGNKVRIASVPNGCPKLSAEKIKETLSKKKSCGAFNNKIIASCVLDSECSEKGKQEYIANNDILCDAEYICCMNDEITPKKTYTKKSQLPVKKEKKGDSLCTSQGGNCVFTTTHECIGSEWARNKCLSNPSRNYLCCPTGNTVAKRDELCKENNGVCLESCEEPYSKEIIKENERLCHPALKCCTDAVGVVPLASGICVLPCDTEKENQGCIELGAAKREDECGHYCAWKTAGDNSGCYKVEDFAI